MTKIQTSGQMITPTYEQTAWVYEFRDENDGVLLSLEFAVSPAHIGAGEFVDFSTYGIKGRVTKVSHLFRESEDVKSLRHVIGITLDTSDVS